MNVDSGNPPPETVLRVGLSANSTKSLSCTSIGMLKWFFYFRGLAAPKCIVCISGKTHFCQRPSSSMVYDPVYTLFGPHSIRFMPRPSMTICRALDAACYYFYYFALRTLCMLSNGVPIRVSLRALASVRCDASLPSNAMVPKWCAL